MDPSEFADEPITPFSYKRKAFGRDFVEPSSATSKIEQFRTKKMGSEISDA